jgi:hypothetical protein
VRELQARTQGGGTVISKKTILLALTALRRMRRKIFIDRALGRASAIKLNLNIENAILELTLYMEELNDRKNP